MDSLNSLAFDTQHIWHPYTSMTEPVPAFSVASAKGVILELEDGRQLVDGMASWWSVIHGYNHPVLNAAVTDQLEKMAHVMFGGLTHQPAIDLARKLVGMTAENLRHVFFADSGSVAVEVAIKMAIQYWFAQGQTDKCKLLTVRNGYHGDTFGAMAVCDPVNGMHEMFTRVLPQHLFAAAPECHATKSQTQEKSPETNIASFEKLITKHPSEIAAVILEPIVQGAGGMRIYCPEYLQEVRRLCDRHDVLLILDEIATGFGRTGTLFAYEQATIQPDILTLGKALTGGYMTLAATLASEEVAHGISADGEGVLMHGPTFMANPLACSVANASIDLLLDFPWQQRISGMEQQLRKELMPCESLSVTREVRVKGAVGVVELNCPVDVRWMQPRFVEAGVWVRPFSNLVYIMPAYTIAPDELNKVTAAICKVLQEFDSLSRKST